MHICTYAHVQPIGMDFSNVVQNTQYQVTRKMEICGQCLSHSIKHGRVDYLADVNPNVVQKVI